MNEFGLTNWLDEIHKLGLTVWLEDTDEHASTGFRQFLFKHMNKIQQNLSTTYPFNFEKNFCLEQHDSKPPYILHIPRILLITSMLAIHTSLYN